MIKIYIPFAEYLLACPRSSLFILLLYTSFLSIVNDAQAQQPFVTVWKTDIPGESNSTSVTIPTIGGGYNYQVDWNNDGTYEQTGVTGSVTHDFGVAGTYTIRITGLLPRIFFNGMGDSPKLLDIVSWGDLSWTNMSRAFAGCSNLNITTNSIPDLTAVTNMSSMFEGCENLNGPSNIGDWSTGKVTNMSRMFAGAAKFNQSVNNWNTANVTDMTEMFLFAETFNRPISNWNTSKVISMNAMFRGAIVFNQPISGWDTSSVTDMSSLFSDAHDFNQPIGSWNTSKVINMNSTFRGAISFNQPIGNWNTVNVTDMAGMFISAIAFNQSLSEWNTSNVTDMSGMFVSATAFNESIGNWNTSSVTNMSAMFREASSFNRPIGKWNTSNVINMSEMFYLAPQFNQPIGDWDVGDVILMTSMFRGSRTFNQPIANWNTSSAIDMVGMFYDAQAFNQPIGEWNTGNVINMNVMFTNAASFNQPIGKWNTINVVRMSMMFFDAEAFNQPIGSWDVRNTIDMENMFSGAAAFNQSIGRWTLNPLVSLTDLFLNSGLDCDHYSATLIGWSENPSTPDDVDLNANGLLYGTGAADARAKLVDMKNWKITGDSSSGEDCSALPVVLITFTGESVDTGNQLVWETAIETTNAGFEIEKSADARTFEKVAFVDGRGNSKERNTYHFTDTTPMSTTYYRLNQIDFDGQTAYSRIILVKRRQSKFVVYPNPTTGVFYLKGLSGNIKLLIRNKAGQIVYKQSHFIGDAVQVNQLPVGTYFISVQGEIKKIAIQPD